MEKEYLSTWVEIDQDAISHNIALLAGICQRPLMAVVKANGYGHGLIPVAQGAITGGAVFLGVARFEEALELRSSGIDTPILILGYTSPTLGQAAAAENISVTVMDADSARAFSQQMKSSPQPLKVHAKFDTGMGRLGIPAAQGLSFLQLLGGLSGIIVEGMFSHLASADEPGKPTTRQQLALWDLLIRQVEEAGLRPRWIHAANSAGLLNFPQASYDLVRSGIAIYGLHPSDQSPLPSGFLAALTWKARLTSIKTLPAGHGVGYNHRYTTRKTERIGVISAGYADGFRRRLGNIVLCGGRRVPVVGGVCMDQCMLQLDDLPQAQIGDEVVLLGRQGNEVITAEDIASAWQTVNYEVVCGISSRVPRLIIHLGN